MSAVAEILWEAAADVERRGALTEPDRLPGNRTCLMKSLMDRGERWERWCETPAVKVFRYAEGVPVARAAMWNDSQPSRAVVAAAMRDAAYLAEWAGDHLLGGSK